MLGHVLGTGFGSRPSTSCIGLDSGVVRVVCLCPAVLVLMTMTNVRTPRVGGSGGGFAEWLEQDATQGLPRRRAAARLQAVPLLCRASGRFACLDLGPLPWFPLAMTMAAKGRVNGRRNGERARGWRMTQRVMKDRACGNPGGYPLPPPPFGLGGHPGS